MELKYCFWNEEKPCAFENERIYLYFNSNTEINSQAETNHLIITCIVHLGKSTVS